MQPSADLNKNLLDKIINMTPSEQESYFVSLSNSQKAYIKSILLQKAQPAPTCDIFDKHTNFTDWITSHFYVPELNGPIWLAQYQIDALNEATKKDESGLYKYSLIAWMDIKKSIKSCIAAAVALRMAFMREWSSIKVVANKRDQAQSRSFFYITRSLKLNPITAAMLENNDISITYYTINFNFNNSTIKAIPLNPEGEAGGNDDLIIWTEAWAAKTKAAQTMFTEMVIPPNKFGRGFKWLESYAGYSGDSPILETIYNENVKEEHKIENTESYVNGRTFVLCNHTPKLPWQTSEYYRQQEKELSESEFRRVHRNEWQSSTNKFVDDIVWQNCKADIPDLKRNEKLVLAIDVGLTNDTFALIGVNKIKGKAAVRIVKVWKPRKGEKIKFSNPTGDSKNDDDYPYDYIKKLNKLYNILVVFYDPYQAEKLAEDMLYKEKINFEAFSQQSLRLKADKYLHDLIRSKEILHNGDRTLTQHIKNANAESKGENKLRIVKSSQSSKVDAAVALSMACYGMRNYNV